MSFKQLEAAIVNIGNQVFGEDVTYTPVSGSPVTIRGVFSHKWVEVSDVSTFKPTLIIALSDLSAPPKNGDTVVVETTTYRVMISQPDSFGGAILILQAV
jgi:hypothetical protein